jgi:hypothetical protein
MKALVYMNEEDMKSLGIPMVLQGLCVFLTLPFSFLNYVSMLILCLNRRPLWVEAICIYLRW